MYENYYVDLMVICVDVTVVILDFAIVGLFIQSVSKQKNILENEAILARVKNEISLYRSMSDNLEKQRRKSHEFNNHMAAIKGMLEQGRIDELQDYVSVIVEKEKKLPTEINANHAIINAIINTKYEETRQKDNRREKHYFTSIGNLILRNAGRLRSTTSNKITSAFSMSGKSELFN